MSDASPILSRDLPPSIARALQRLIRRVRSIVLVRGISATVAALVGSLLLVMAIDASVTLFSQWSRWLLTLSALAFSAGVAVWFLILPLARTITLTGIARFIETRHPELQERLSSAVELLTSKDAPEIRGSEALIAALAEEASHDADRVRPRTEIPLKSARPFLIAALGVVAILGAVLALHPSAAWLLERAVAPYLNLPNIHADMLRVFPGDTILAEDQRLEVEVTVANQAVKRATLYKVLPDGSERGESMIALPPSESGERRFTLACPPANQSFKYRVHAGDALTRYYSATVVPPPLVKRTDVRYKYPDYTGREPSVETGGTGDIRAVAGTVVTVQATTNKAIKAAELRINGLPAPQQTIEVKESPEGASLCRFDLKLTPRMRGRWALVLTDSYGFSKTSGEHMIEALPDEPPTVKIVNPEQKKLRLKPTDQLPVGYVMTDDFGFRGADFVVDTDTHKHARVPIQLKAEKGQDRFSAAGMAALALAGLPLEGAKQISFRVRAVDNLPPDLKGPQEGISELVTVELDISAASYASQMLTAEEESVRKALEKILKELKTSKQDSVPLKDNVARAATLSDDMAKRVVRMLEHLGVAKATTAELIAAVTDGAFTGLLPKLNQLGGEVGAANDRTGQVKLADAAADRGKAATEADEHIDKAIALVLELLKQLKEMAEAAQLAQALEDMAKREAELAAEKAAMEPGEKQAAAEWQKDQAKLAKEVGQLVKETPAALKAQLAQSMQAAKDLANEARQLEKEQKALAENTKQEVQLQQIDKALEKLAAEQTALAKETAASKVGPEQAKPMAAAADNIQAGALAQAVDQQKAAENALNQIASGQQPAGQQQAGQQQQGGQPPTAEQSQQAGQLGAKQQDIRQRTEALMAQRNEAANAMAQSQLARLQAEQAQVAQEAAQLAQNVQPVGGEPAQTSQQAAADAQQAANQIPQNMPQAAQSATKAGQELGNVAQNLANQAAQQAAGQQQRGQQESGQQQGGQEKGGQEQGGQEKGGQEQGGQEKGGQEKGGQEKGGQQQGGQEKGGQQQGGQQQGGQQSPSPGQMAQMAQQAAELAERQNQLAREMQALAAGNPQQALAAEQAGLAQRTGDLRQEAAQLGQEAGAMIPQSPAAQQAGQAAQSLGQAQQSENQAQQAMAAGQPQAAGPPQQVAAQALEAAANALSQMGQTLAQALAGQPATSPGEAAMGQPMAQAYNAATEAAQSPSTAAAAEAASALAQAAAEAGAHAAEMGAHPGQEPGAMAGMMPGQPGQVPSQNRNSKMGIGAVNMSLTAAKLESLGIKLSDWAKLPGELRNQILQAAEEAGPEEYRALIKRYFQQVAKKGSASPEGGK